MADTVSLESIYLKDNYFLEEVEIRPHLHQVVNGDGVVKDVGANKILALAQLAENYGDIVSRSTLHKILTGVEIGLREDTTLTHHIRKIREALGDTPKNSRFLKTIRGSRNKNWQETKQRGFTLLVKPSFDKPIVWRKEPYLGLNTFEFEHKQIFFGRRQAVLEVIGFLQQKADNGAAFIMITGPSGAGKSSLAKAGVVPALTDQLNEYKCKWRHSTFRFSEGAGDPFDDLADAIVSAVPEILESVSGTSFLADALRNNPTKASTVILGLISGDVEINRPSKKSEPKFQIAVVVDQLEELFSTRSIQPAELDDFVLALKALSESGWCYIIATLRNDFLPIALENSTLARLSDGGGVYSLVRPSISEMRLMISEPANVAGLRLEEDIVHGALADLILDDASRFSPSLAALSFTLTQLYKSRKSDQTITIANYHEIGGLKGCLARHAEQVFTSIPSEGQNSLNELLAHLVSIHDSGASDNQVVVKPADWDHLVESPNCRHLAMDFKNARLLTITSSRKGKRIVRISHESILTHWPRAQEWIKANSHLIRLHERISRQARDWEAHKLTNSLLLPSGLRLNEGQELLESSFDLSSSVQYFIEKSIETVAKSEKIEQIKNRLTASLAVLFFIVSIFALESAYRAGIESERASAERDRAKAVSEFMVESFEKAMPWATSGKEVTARDLLDANVERLEKNESVPDQQRAALLLGMGRAYSSLGEGRKAITLLRESQSILLRQDMVDQQALADSLKSLGWAVARYGEIDSEHLSNSSIAEGTKLLRQALKLYRSDKRSDEQLEIAETLNNLALLVQQKGRYFEAEQLLRESLQAQSEIYGTNSIELVTTKGNIGYSLMLQEKLTEAESWLRESVAVERTLYSKSDPKLAYALNRLAQWYSASGNHQDATNLYEEILEIRTSVYDSKHYLIALSKNNLAKVLLDSNSPEIQYAVELLESAIEIAIQAHGKNHTYVAIYQTNLTEALVRSNQYALAIKTGRVARSNYESKGGDIEKWRIDVLDSILGEALSGAGFCEEGRQLVNSSYTALLNKKGERSQRTIAAKRRLSSSKLHTKCGSY